MVVSPLAILGLDFLMEQQASIDLTLHLKERGCNIPLHDLQETPTELPVHAASAPLTVYYKWKATTVDGEWVVEEVTGKQLPLAVACALVEPTSTVIPLSNLNHTEEPVTVYAGMWLATMHSVNPHMLIVEAVGGGEPEEVVETEDVVEHCRAVWSPGERNIFYCPTQEERTNFVTISTQETHPAAMCPSPNP